MDQRTLNKLKLKLKQTHMLNASGLPEFNSTSLNIANFLKTPLFLRLFQDSIPQQYDTTSLGNHILAFQCNIESFSLRVKVH
jgi:hypothetical protein